MKMIGDMYGICREELSLMSVFWDSTLDKDRMECYNCYIELKYGEIA